MSRGLTEFVEERTALARLEPVGPQIPTAPKSRSTSQPPSVSITATCCSPNVYAAARAARRLFEKVRRNVTVDRTIRA